jgi:hypothetical protein
VWNRISAQTQFGHTLFIDGFEAGSSATKLEGLHFSRNGLDSESRQGEKLLIRRPALLEGASGRPRRAAQQG